MRVGKVFAYALTAVFLALAVFTGVKEAEYDTSFAAVVSVQEKEEQILPWQSYSGEVYFFLPGGVDLSQVKLRVARDDLYRIGDRPVVNGMCCDAFSLGTPYELTVEDGTAAAITFLQSGGVDTLFVDVTSGSMAHIHEDKRQEETGTMRLYSAEGLLTYEGNLDSVNGRGNSTWNREKKPYNLELQTAADLLGMGEAKNWVLLANSMDTSNLRNKIAYDFAAAAGLSYSPESRWVDLYLNGEYAGLYLLCERNEIHTQRVDIPEEGSFLVVKDGEWRFQTQEKPYIMTENNVALRIYHADMDADALKGIFQSVENAILAADGIDPVTGKSWMELIDLDSWARKYLVEEVLANVDAATFSQFYYMDGSEPGGKIYAGPVWDFDLAMANRIAYENPVPNMFYESREGIYGSPWLAALYQKEAFYERLLQLYETEVLPLLEDLLHNRMDEYIHAIAPAAELNSIRWYAQDMAEEAESIRAYLTERMAFLNRVWLENEEHVLVYLFDYDGAVLCYALRPGEKLPQIAENRQIENVHYDGWFNMETGLPFDFSKPIYEDTKIELRYTVEDIVQEEQEESEEPFAVRKLYSLVLLVLSLVVVMTADYIKRKGTGGRKHDANEASEVSS